MTKIFFLLLVVGFVGCVEKKTEVKSEATTSQAAVNLDGKEEDCDDKAKEKIEIKEETISLSNNTGCTLDE